MKISQVKSFNTGFYGNRYVLFPGYKINKKEIEQEEAQAKRARRFGISVPDYASSYDDELNKRLVYETKGDIANPKTNPISKKHLKNLFKNLYLMDKAGIYHNDFDEGHIFFSKDGDVEFDCFRYSFNFVKKPNGKLSGNNGSIRTPEFVMPSNAAVFEEQYLGGYISKFKNEAQKQDFMQNYLRQKGYYHQKRAELLVERGFDPEGKTVLYEKIQSEALQNPSDDMINFTLERAELLKQKRQAYTEWDEGNGAAGHPEDPERRFKSILMHLDCIVPAYNLNNRAEHLARSSSNGADNKYFKFEKELTKLWLNNLYDDTKGMALWNFNDNIKHVYLGTQEEKKEFEELYSEIDLGANVDNLSAQVKEARSFYNILSAYWTADSNEENKVAFESAL